jgi:hypothetical protein
MVYSYQVQTIFSVTRFIKIIKRYNSLIFFLTKIWVGPSCRLENGIGFN